MYCETVLLIWVVGLDELVVLSALRSRDRFKGDAAGVVSIGTSGRPREASFSPPSHRVVWLVEADSENKLHDSAQQVYVVAAPVTPFSESREERCRKSPVATSVVRITPQPTPASMPMMRMR